MPRFRTRIGSRGFSLIEMMFAMGILGLVLSLTLAEFITAFGHFSFAQTHMDAEMAGRVAMSKVNDVLQLASSDHNPADTPGCSAKCQIIVNPLAFKTLGNSNDVAIIVTTTDPGDPNGQLSSTMNTVGQVPRPDYQVVELSYDAIKQAIMESRSTYSAYITGGAPSSTSVLARNVENFNITPLNWDPIKGFASGLQVNIQTSGPAQGGRPASVANTSNTVYFSTYAGFQ
ncbi:MAG TPA: prepilin-type N-terminal cleavage/methylation domain-containing protein [Candidatus Eremiobacteraceae bacterium]